MQTQYLLFVDGRGEYARYDFKPGNWFTTSDPEEAMTLKSGSRAAVFSK